MKIIGETPGGFILEASCDEVANLVGYYSRYDGAFCKRQIRPGDQIQVHQMYQRLYMAARRRNEIRTAAKMLRDAAGELELADPILRAADEEPKAEQA